MNTSSYLSVLKDKRFWSMGPYNLHQWLWEHYKEYDQGSKAQCLFRVDGDVVYVRSQYKPDPWRSEEAALYTETVDVQPGAVLSVNVILNPVRRGQTETPIVDQDGVAAFVVRVMEGAGMRVLPALSEEDDDLVESRPSVMLKYRPNRVFAAKQNQVPLFCREAIFNADVVDAEKAASSIVSGVGRKKGFGCGMLMVRERVLA